MSFDDTVFGNPTFDPGKTFVSTKATIIGDVVIENDVMVAPGACLRADEGSPFFIGRGTNIQDGVVMHGLHKKYVEVDGKKYSIHIATHCSITHGALVHGPTLIGKKTFVGFGTKIHNSIIGRNCHIGHGAMVIDVCIANNREVVDGLIVNSQEIADNLPKISEEKREFNKVVVDYNKEELLRRYQIRRKIKNVSKY